MAGIDGRCMSSDGKLNETEFLTTREVAELLRVKERKVYDLAAAGEIPHRRITGKLLFPRAELTAWIDGTGPGAIRTARPPVIAGSHDPLLDWAVRESACALAMLVNGSRDGLDSFAAGQAAAAGLHVPDDEGWNVRSVAALDLRDAVLVTWASRQRGLLVSRDASSQITGINDLRGRRVILRQPSAGASALFDILLSRAGLSPEDLKPSPALARTESDAAAAVAAGEADAALGIEAMASRYGLPFRPLLQENFDLLIDRHAYFTPPIQTLLRFARTEPFLAKADAMGGYDVSDLGTVRWLSP
ncbi:MAG: helix-turn-helix transcriptional regulator [Pseudomonadota bacterium]